MGNLFVKGEAVSDKPSYLGLLNAIAVGEARAHCYLSEWIAVSPDPAVKKVLATVCAREGEHGMAFAKRINELGYSVREREDPDTARRRSIAASTELTDLEKFEKLGLGRLTDSDPFDNIFHDRTFDIETAALMGRYIAEERDSARRLAACCGALAVQAKPPASSDAIATLTAKVDALCAAVEDLRRVVRVDLTV